LVSAFLVGLDVLNGFVFADMNIRDAQNLREKLPDNFGRAINEKFLYVKYVRKGSYYISTKLIIIIEVVS